MHTQGDMVPEDMRSSGASESRFRRGLHRLGSWYIFGRKLRLVFLFKYMLLILMLIMSTVTLVFYGIDLHTSISRREAAITSLTVSKLVAVLATEADDLHSGRSCDVACAPANALLHELAGHKHVPRLSIAELRAKIEEAREGATAKSPRGAQSLEDYNTASLMLIESLYGLYGEQTDTASGAQIALVCLILQSPAVFNHFSLLSDHIVHNWDAWHYQSYLGTAYTRVLNPNCTTFLASAEKFSIADGLEMGPRLAQEPKLSYAKVTSPPSDVALRQATQWISTQIDMFNNELRKHWRSRVIYCLALTVAMTVACLLLLGLVVTMPMFVSLFERDTGGAVLAEYVKVEGKLKVLAQYMQSIATLKESEKLHSFLEDTFLRKISIFVQSVRTFIPQTCFGDIEIIAVTGAKGGALSPADDAAGLAMFDENEIQDLRTTLGLRPSHGTLMCVATHSRTHQYDPESIHAFTEQCTQWTCSLIHEIECVANANGGSLHTVNGDYIFVTWSVVSGCRNAEVNALQTALELITRSQRSSQRLSISIGSGTLLAGTVDDGVCKHPLLCGRVVTRCEQMTLINEWHHTNLMLDEAVARRLNAASVPGYDWCIVPVCLYGARTEPEGLRTACAVYPVRLTDSLKSWTAFFRPFKRMIEEGKYAELLQMVEKYQHDHIAIHAGESGLLEAGLYSENDKTINFWIAMLQKLTAQAEIRSASVTPAASRA